MVEDLKTLAVLVEDLHGLLGEMVLILLVALVVPELVEGVVVHPKAVKLVVMEDQVSLLLGILLQHQNQYNLMGQMQHQLLVMDTNITTLLHLVR